jgi:cell division protein FtsI (penicillin-binding protein 3)
VKGRLVLLVGILVLWMGAISVRLGQLQIEDHAEYLDRAKRQQQRVVDLDPPRGTIFDRNGRELAVSVEVESAYAVPDHVKDPAREARQLAHLLGVDRTRLERTLRRDREFVWVARKLDDPVAQKVRALHLPGIDFLRESKRYYPARELAAAVLGYVGTDNKGLGGVEAAYDKVIAGTRGRQTVLRDARRGTAVSPNLAAIAPQSGADLTLTLDAAIQYVAERELDRTVRKERARGGTVVVLDVTNGAILAMASAPGFDPNRFAAFPQSSWRNRAVMDAYEPGSTFKMVTVAAALENNLLDPSDTFDCEMGSITLVGHRIRDHRPFGVLTVQQIIQKSSNVGAIKIGLVDGPQRLYKAIEAFGFGKLTGVDLPGETPGLLRPVAAWRPLTTAYIAFGQGLSVSPLQLASAFGAVANGGTLYRPYVVEAIRTEEGVRRRRAPQILGHPIDAATARSVERMLEMVVESGTGTAAAIPGYRVAGKTGTAQKAVPGAGYSANRYVGSFVGFAPARQPRIVCLVTIDAPRSGRYHGGQVAAPVFATVVQEALRRLDIPPERETDEVAPPPQAPADSWRRPISTVASADRTRDDVVPDFSGMTAREAIVRSAQLGIEVQLEGDGGFVQRQTPAALAPLRRGASQVRLWLGDGATG